MSKSASLQLNINIDPNIATTFRKWDRGEHKYFLCELDKVGDNLTLTKVADKNATIDDFCAEFQDDRCAIAVYKLEFEVKDVGKRDKNLIVSWTPMKATVKSRMIQANSVGLVKSQCDGISVIHQAGGLEDLSEEIFYEKIQKFLRF
jgi:hypothetical protein